MDANSLATTFIDLKRQLLMDANSLATTFIDLKRCPRCGIIKTLEEFTTRKSGRVGHPVAHCKACRVEAVRNASKRDPSIYRRIDWPSKLKRFYGLTVEGYYEMLTAQDGGCAICGSKSPKSRGYKRIEDAMFCVDHNHKTGIVRGLLCTACNRAVGLINDSPETARSLWQYLLKEETK